jgi:hypothetical protein
MNSLELLAFDYLTYAENDAYNLPIVYIFAIVFGFIKKVDFRLQRGTYFLNSAFIIFLASIASGIYFLSFDAILNGYLFAIVLLDIIIWAVVAYLFLVIAKARSNDAYGHSRYAVLSFIPLANLWLVFVPSKDEFAPKMTALTGGAAAVVIGLIISIAGRGFGVAVSSAMDTYATTTVAEKHGRAIALKYFQYNSQRDSLEAGLEYYKTLDVIGNQIDEITYLKDIVVEEDTITYKFLITDNTITGFTQERRDVWENYICNNHQPLFDAGANMIFHYYSDAEPLLAYVIGNTEVCSL